MQVKVWVLKFHKKYLEKKFPNLYVKVLISRIIKIPAKNPSLIKVDLLIVATPRKWADNDDYTVSLRAIMDINQIVRLLVTNYIYSFSYRLMIY